VSLAKEKSTQNLLTQTQGILWYILKSSLQNLYIQIDLTSTCTPTIQGGIHSKITKNTHQINRLCQC
jgi:hypothetical protein